MSTTPLPQVILLVTASDDPARVGQRLEIRQLPASLGRASADLTFPEDSPVSGCHARLEEQGGRLVLSEVETVNARGLRKLPRYGTFVNDQPVKIPTPLGRGDCLRLGRRLTLQIEKIALTRQTDPDDTFDDYQPTQPAAPTDDLTLD